MVGVQKKVVIEQWQQWASKFVLKIKYNFSTVSPLVLLFVSFGFCFFLFFILGDRKGGAIPFYWKKYWKTLFFIIVIKKFYYRSSGPPSLIQTLLDKKIKIGEIVELSIAGLWKRYKREKLMNRRNPSISLRLLYCQLSIIQFF